jgi:hypothetical protein
VGWSERAGGRGLGLDTCQCSKSTTAPDSEASFRRYSGCRRHTACTDSRAAQALAPPMRRIMHAYVHTFTHARLFRAATRSYPMQRAPAARARRGSAADRQRTARQCRTGLRARQNRSSWAEPHAGVPIGCRALPAGLVRVVYRRPPSPSYYSSASMALSLSGAAFDPLDEPRPLRLL